VNQPLRPTMARRSPCPETPTKTRSNLPRKFDMPTPETLTVFQLLALSAVAEATSEKSCRLKCNQKMLFLATLRLQRLVPDAAENGFVRERPKPHRNVEDAVGVELRVLRWAIVAAQHKSLRRAAESLNIRQSTLSRGLRDLEHRLGAILFERTVAPDRRLGERF
jgi:hypothetical protein